jgi:hypothetical protein
MAAAAVSRQQYSIGNKEPREEARNNEGMQQMLRWYELKKCAEMKDGCHWERMHLVVSQVFWQAKVLAGGLATWRLATTSHPHQNMTRQA